MAKKTPVKPRVPRTRGGETLTEAQFWGMIRSAFRQRSMFWPPINKCKKNARRPYEGENKRRKWEYQCAKCKEWWAEKETVVHHIIPTGELKKYDDLPGFVERMFCEIEGFEVLCKNCHKDIHQKIKENESKK